MVVLAFVDVHRIPSVAVVVDSRRVYCVVQHLDMVLLAALVAHQPNNVDSLDSILAVSVHFYRCCLLIK